MMPWLHSLVLRRLGSLTGLLLLIVVCLAFPARHVLLPLWPDAVEEVLVEIDSGEVGRQLRTVGSTDHETDSPVLARTRPITLWRLETDEGVVNAWIAGVRNSQGQLEPTLPDWLEPVRLDAPDRGVRLVLRSADRELVEVEIATVTRMYRPNVLDIVDRTVLWRDRLFERWRE